MRVKMTRQKPPLGGCFSVSAPQTRVVDIPGLTDIAEFGLFNQSAYEGVEQVSDAAPLTDWIDSALTEGTKS